MADRKDQRMIDPLEGSNQESSISRTDDQEMIDQSVEESKIKKLNDLKRTAFYSVLLAFRAETLSSLGNKRTQIIEQLRNECSISQEIFVAIEDNIQKNVVAKQPRVDSDAKPPTVEKQKLKELQRRAFYSVLLAFRSETLSSGNKRTQIIETLMNELSIAQETRVSLENNIQKTLVADQQRVDSDAKETNKPLTTIRQPAKKRRLFTPYSTSLPRVNPKALIGRRVWVRMDGEEEFDVLVITEFNAKDGTHRFATVDPNVSWLSEASSWIDVSKVPAEDIRWIDGEMPDFHTSPEFGAWQ